MSGLEWVMLGMMLLSAVTTVYTLSQSNDGQESNPAGKDKLSIPTTSASRSIPVVFGTAKITGPNVVDYWGFEGNAIEQDGVTVGYAYFLEGIITTVCWGDTDGSGSTARLTRIGMGDYEIWSGSMGGPSGSSPEQVTVNSPFLFGGQGQGGGIISTIVFHNGDRAQNQNPFWNDKRGNIPNYHGLAYLSWGGSYIGEQPSLRPIWYVVERLPNPFGHASNHDIDGDANGAYCIWEMWTNPVWGAGWPESRLDRTSFEDVADTLKTEGLGVSFVFNKENNAEKMEAEILKHIGAVMYTDNLTGKRKIKLVRDDYTIGTLPELTDSEIVKISNFRRGSLTGLTTEVKVKYTDRDAEFQERVAISQNTGARLNAGRPVTAILNYAGLSNSSNAQKVVDRELIPLSTNPTTMNIDVDRTAWDWHIGKVFKLSSTTYNISQIVLRVSNIRFGDLKSGKITIQAVEDQFAYGTAIYSDNPASNTEVLVNDPTTVANQIIMEVPNWFVLNDIDLQKYQVFNLVDDPTSDAFSYDGYYDLTGSYQLDQTNKPFTRNWTMNAAYDQWDTTMVIAADIKNFDAHTSGEIKTGENLLLIEGDNDHEIIGFESASSDGSVTTLTGVKRGLLDTTPQDISSGARVWEMDSKSTWRDVFSVGDDIDFKHRTNTFNGKLDLSSATAFNHVIDSRADRPLAPGRFEINSSGDSAPSQLSGDTQLDWEDRDGTSSAMAFQTDTGITSEAGVTYNIDFINPHEGSPERVIRSVRGLATTTYTYTEAQEETDNGGQNVENLKIELWSTGGQVSPSLDSHQKQVRTIRRKYKFTDDFNRADASPCDGEWSPIGGATGFDLVSNKVQIPGSPAVLGEGMYHRSDLAAPVYGMSADQYAQVDFTTIPTAGTGYGDGIGVRVNASGSQYAYALVDSTGTLRLFLSSPVGGTATLYTSSSGAVSNGDTLKLQATGTGAAARYQIWINAVDETGELTPAAAQQDVDDGFASLQFVLFTTSGGTLDNFECGDV